MSFFDPIPPPEEPCEDENVVEEWQGPPANVLGGMVACQLLLARTDEVVLVATYFEAYPTGLAFRLVARMRTERADLHQRFVHWARAGDPSAALRIGVLFPDGRRAESLPMDFESAGDPARPLLWPRGGGGSEAEWHQDYWLWPAPPDGDLVIVAQWTDESIAETRGTIDARLLVDARTRILEVWPAEG